MNKIQSQLRHLLTFLAGIGGLLAAQGVIDAEAAAAIDKAGADLIEPIAVFAGAICAGLTRQAMFLLGKKFPFLSAGNSEGGVSGSGGGSGGIPPLALMLAAGLFCIAALPSCSGEYPLSGSIVYRDPGSGAKGGLSFTPGQKPTAYVRVPIIDPDTGEQLGFAELEVPVAGAVDAGSAK